MTHHLLLRIASATPEPAERVVTPPEELVTPGTIGFLVTFAVAVAFVLLVRDMVRRNRRLALRAERRDARLRAAAQGDPSAAVPGDPPPGGPVEPPSDTRPGGPVTPGDRSDRPGGGPAGPNG